MKIAILCLFQQQQKYCGKVLICFEDEFANNVQRMFPNHWAKPEKGTLPGYFFYQTREGFKFKAIDRLIEDGKKNPKATYEEIRFKENWRKKFNVFEELKSIS